MHRGRGGRGSYNTSNSRSYDRSVSNNNDSTAEILSKILSRLEALERSGPRSSSSSFRGSARPPTPKRQSTTHDQRDGHPDESVNADFRLLVRETFRYAQAAHHLENWSDCPRSIDANIDRLVGDIRPPAASPRLTDGLQRAADEFRSSLVAIVSEHLSDVQREAKRRFDQLDHADNDKVRAVVERQLQRRLGGRAHRSVIRRALDEFESTTARRSEASGWTEAVRRHHRSSKLTDDATSSHHGTNRSPTTSVHSSTNGSPSTRSAVPTANRFEALAPSSTRQPSSPPPMDVVPNVSTAAVALPQRKQTTKLSLSKKRLRIRSPTEDGSSSGGESDDTIGTLAALRSEQLKATTALRIHHPGDRRKWKIVEPPASATCLVIADSNGASWLDANLPTEMAVDALRGGKTHDAVTLLNEATHRLDNIDTVVIAVGLNDRAHPTPENIVLDLHCIREWGYKANKRTWFLEIPLFKSTITTAECDTLEHFNAAARDVFGTDFINIDQSAVRVSDADATGIHYLQHTARHMVSRVYECLNVSA